MVHPFWLVGVAKKWANGKHQALGRSEAEQVDCSAWLCGTTGLPMMLS